MKEFNTHKFSLTSSNVCHLADDYNGENVKIRKKENCSVETEEGGIKYNSQMITDVNCHGQL